MQAAFKIGDSIAEMQYRRDLRKEHERILRNEPNALKKHGDIEVYEKYFPEYDLDCDRDCYHPEFGPGYEEELEELDREAYPEKPEFPKYGPGVCLRY
uniref:Uncharacterized protein n=1 Tax=Panagrolaimus sp. JU765 TaxID=591449 RepID=A0AC34QVW7_9BILA